MLLSELICDFDNAYNSLAGTKTLKNMDLVHFLIWNDQYQRSLVELLVWLQ
jgi:hypothetical protein